MTFDHRELMEKNLERQIAWLRAGDAKISMLLPVDTVMLAVPAAQLGSAHLTAWHWGFATVASLPSFYSFFSAVRAAMPHFQQKGRSLIYLGDIAEQTPESYRTHVVGLTAEQMTRDAGAGL
jgi:hypothetical protein